MSMFTIAGAPTIEEGDMELIFSTTLTSDADSIDTGTLPTGYKSYQIFFNLRSDRDTFHQGFEYVYFNNDQTVTNYQLFTVSGGSSSTAVTSLAQSLPAAITSPSASGDANFFGGSSMVVFNPESSTAFKAFEVTSGSNSKASGTSSSERINSLRCGVWRNQSPITSIQIVETSTDSGGTAGLVAGSSVQIYGMK